MNLRAGVPMSLVCKVRLMGILFLGLICISCGDVYRPTIIPNPVPTPDPKNFHSAIAISQNASVYPGSGMQVDVSGDSNAGVTKVAVGPVHGAIQPGCSQTACKVWVANNLSDSVSVFFAATSVAATSGGSIGTSTDINLLLGSRPVFVHSAETGTMYVANSGKLTDPNTLQPYYAVDAISATTPTTSVLTTEIRVAGTTPWALAETPDGKKLYVVNRDSNNVTVINTVDKSVGATVPVGAAPSLAYARNDSQRVYVLNPGGGTISTIRTIDDVVVKDNNNADPPVDSGANFMIYDGHLNRLYVTSSSGSLYVFNTAVDPDSQTTSFLIKQIPIPGAGDCAQCVPVSVAALSDGTRVYVGSAFETTDTTKCVQVVGGSPVNCYLTQITVVDAASLTIKTGSATAPNPFPVPTPTATVLAGAPVLAQAGCATTRFRLSVVPASDSSRVFLAACDASGVSTINTANDTYVVTLPAPVSAFPPIQTDPNVPPQPPRQNPVFLLTGQ